MRRKYLIELADRAIVPVDNWNHPDTEESQLQLGTFRALLKAGCPFEVLPALEEGTQEEEFKVYSDENTTWVQVWYPNRSRLEEGYYNINDKSTLASDTFYLPTDRVLIDGVDWNN